MIRYLKHNEIDKTKWDECIKNSNNLTPFAFSWYWDVVHPKWDAIVMDDYEAIMPLPTKEKYGISYIIQPFLTPQGGIFSKNLIDDTLCNNFLNTIPNIYKYININLNKSNQFNPNPNWIINRRYNHYLDLSQSYENLRKSYSRRTLRNIKNAEDSKIKINESTNNTEFVNFKAQYAQPKLPANQKKIMKLLIEQYLQMGKGNIITAHSQKGELTGAAFYFIEQNQLVFLITVSSSIGKKYSVMHLVLDYIINKHCSSNLLMDFTGSSLKGVAYFNEGFGAKPVEYLQIIRNKLPWFLKIFKK
jgi:hypothetical protein